MGAADAEGGRTVGDDLGHCGTLGHGVAEGDGDLLGVELAVAADGLVEAAVHGLAFAEEAFDVLFDEGLAVLEDEDFVALVIELAQHVEG